MRAVHPEGITLVQDESRKQAGAGAAAHRTNRRNTLGKTQRPGRLFCQLLLLRYWCAEEDHSLRSGCLRWMTATVSRFTQISLPASSVIRISHTCVVEPRCKGWCNCRNKTAFSTSDMVGIDLKPDTIKLWMINHHRRSHTAHCLCQYTGSAAMQQTIRLWSALINGHFRFQKIFSNFIPLYSDMFSHRTLSYMKKVGNRQVFLKPDRHNL